MPKNTHPVYVHLAWSTRERAPLISGLWERRLHRRLVAAVVAKDCVVLAVNTTPEHVQMVIQVATDVAIADLMQKVKGDSSAYLRHDLGLGDAFSWQAGYRAISLGKSELSRTIHAIKRLKKRGFPGCSDEENRV